MALLVGDGYLAHAYGKHVVSGVLVESAVTNNPSNNKKVVKFHTLLGIGEWDAVERVVYAGQDLTDYTFYPGVLNPADDTRFPNSLRHGLIARYTVTLPEGLADDADPSQMKVIARCLKMPSFNSAGAIQNSGVYAYSTNPADQFADIVRRHLYRTNLISSPTDYAGMANYFDFAAYATARTYYDVTINAPDYARAVRNFSAVAGGTGYTLPAGDYEVYACVHNGTITSIQAGPILVTVASGQTIGFTVEKPDTLGDTTHLRVTFKRTVDANYSYVDVAQGTAWPATAPYTGNVGSSGTNLGASINTPTGTYAPARPRFESHIWFDKPTKVNEALNTLVWQCASDWVVDGAKFRLLGPAARSSSYALSPANTMPGSFRFWRTPSENRPNRVTAVGFRDVNDTYLREAKPVMVERLDAQTTMDVIDEQLQFFSMTPNQAFRVINFRIRSVFDMNQQSSVQEDGSGALLLPGDVVSFTDATANWSSKLFKIVTKEIGGSDSMGNIALSLVEYSGSAYSDTDSAPLQSTQPVSIPDKYLAPPAVTGLDVQALSAANVDGSVSVYIYGTFTFQPHLGGGAQVANVYHKAPGDTDWSFFTTVNHGSDSGGTGSFILSQPVEGTHQFRVITTSTIGIPQTDAPVDDSVVVDYTAIPGGVVNPLDSLNVAQVNKLLPDGTISHGLKAIMVFDAYPTNAQVGLIYLQRPEDAGFVQVASITPNVTTNTATWELWGLDLGVYAIKVHVCVGPIQQTGSDVTDSVVIGTYTTLPDAPENNPDLPTALTENGQIVWNWNAPPDNPQVTWYEIENVDGDIIARIEGTTWQEPLPDLATVARRIFAVDNLGNRSATYFAANYDTGYEDNRVIFNTPIGSSNFLESGNVSAAVTEPLGVVASEGGSYDDASNVFVKSAPDGWDSANLGGVTFDRALAWGDGMVEMRIGFPSTVINDDNAYVLFLMGGDTYAGISADEVLPPSTIWAASGWGMQPLISAGPVSNIRIYHDNTFHDHAVSWSADDVMRIQIASGVVTFWLNETLLRTASATAKYPMIPGFRQYFQGKQTLLNAQLTGVLQNTLRQLNHWQFTQNVKLNTDNNAVNPNATPSKALSVETYLGSFYVCSQGPGVTGSMPSTYEFMWGIGNFDTAYIPPKRCFLFSKGAQVPSYNGAFNTTDPAFFVYEWNGTSMQIKYSLQSSALAITDQFRIEVDANNDEVRYLFNGAVIHLSNRPASVDYVGQKVSYLLENGTDNLLMEDGSLLVMERDPDAPPEPYYVKIVWGIADSTSGTVLGNQIRGGQVGTKGRGWRVSPNGLAELAEGVEIGGFQITEVQARATTAIDENKRYRGKDITVPQINRLLRNMFYVSNGLYERETNAVTVTVDAMIPEEIINDGYGGWDSLEAFQITSFDMAGNPTSNKIIAMTGGFVQTRFYIPDRGLGDPFYYSVYRFKFKNAYGWSDDVWWIHPAAASTRWGLTSNVSPGFGGTWEGAGNWTTSFTQGVDMTLPVCTTAPPWVSMTWFTTSLSAAPVSAFSAVVSWSAPTHSTPTGYTVFWRKRKLVDNPFDVGTVNRWGWDWIGNVGASGSATSQTIAGLAPDTEYEITVASNLTGTPGGGIWKDSSYAVIRTPSAPPATRPAPSGLTVTSLTQTTLTLNWTANATDNGGVWVYKDNVLLATLGAATTYNVTSLTAGTTYTFKVNNQWATGSPTASTFSNEVIVTTLTTPPPTNNDPTGLYLSNQWEQLTGNTDFDSYVDAHWNRNSGSNARIETNVNNAGWNTYVSGLGTTQDYTIHYGQVMTSQGYNATRQVRIFNATGGVNYSNTVSYSYHVPSYMSCVTLDTKVLMIFENGVTYYKDAGNVVEGDLVVNKFGGPSRVEALRRGKTSRLYCLSTESGKQVWCSPSHPIIRRLNEEDPGKPAHTTEIGEMVLVWDGEKVVEDKLAAKEYVDFEELVVVTTFTLNGEHSYIGGGIVGHNAKPSS